MFPVYNYGEFLISSKILKLLGEAVGEDSLLVKQHHLCKHFTIFS